MAVTFEHQPHPRAAARAKARPSKTSDEHVGLNGKIALAIQGGLLTFIQWVSQTFIQLVMLSVIMVGQNILGRVSDKRAIETYEDAELTLHEAQQIQAHLKVQDEAIGTLLDKLARFEAARGPA